MKTCSFCKFVLPNKKEFLEETSTVVAFEDAFPSAKGHTLVIPKRHVKRVRDMDEKEYFDLFKVAKNQLARLEEKSPDAFTIGINDGKAAGQSVEHVHLHLIPRTVGDVADPKGGLRWVLPETAPYWN